MADIKGATREKKEESELATRSNLSFEKIEDTAIRMAGIDYELQDGEIGLRIAASPTMFVNKSGDVDIRGCYDKTINERGQKIKFLHDHLASIEAQIGTTLRLAIEEISTRELGIESNIETTQTLVHYAVARRSYNEKIYEMYKNDDVKQHSIGLRYVRIDLASREKEYAKEYDNWQKYYNLLLNPERADEFGYFWVVKEIAVRENSAVLEIKSAIALKQNTPKQKKWKPKIDN